MPGAGLRSAHFQSNLHQPVIFRHPLAAHGRAGFQSLRAHGDGKVGDEIVRRFAALGRFRPSAIFQSNLHQPVIFRHPLAAHERAGFQSLRAHGDGKVGDEIVRRFAALGRFRPSAIFQSNLHQPVIFRHPLAAHGRAGL